MLLFFVVFSTKAKGIDKNYDHSIIYQRVFGPSSYSERENSRVPHVYFLNGYATAQICRTQTQRPVSVFKNLATAGNKFNRYFKFLGKTFAQTRVGFVRSSKLILFPFHVFW
ncbi:hypothetical protein HQ865_02380 [Mucilaginibacter mali]|uniref:Uncharacterized protein n=1 Tax=Mucilaginibacter mali TaxID=2740462 RepID=A0A7D4QPL1_9SPHI|nr:hypothetical protein [Mucilaginibacter mali]QKJ28649.1 hypothetical protein HQ865_02380 [Mucilaginibacter mali]